tara:strand:- start:975 stop:1388 length:414 start_codon:yes stop_codon:yes gene_type:complete
MKSKLNKEKILNQFKGVQTLYHCENSDVENYVLESLDNMPKAHKNIWQNISYSNDLCDSFHFGSHDYVGEEIHIKFWIPNSFKDDWNQEQFNQWILEVENGELEYQLIEGEIQKHFNTLSQLLRYVEDNLGDLTFNN